MSSESKKAAPKAAKPVKLERPIKVEGRPDLTELEVANQDITLADLAAANQWAEGDPVLTEIYLWGRVYGVNPEDLRRSPAKNYHLLRKHAQDFY